MTPGLKARAALAKQRCDARKSPPPVRRLPELEIIDARIEPSDRETRIPRQAGDTLGDFVASAGDSRQVDYGAPVIIGFPRS